MVQQPLFEQLALVGRLLPLPRFAVAVQQPRGAPFGVAGWRIATDTVPADHAGVSVGGAATSTTAGFEGKS